MKKLLYLIVTATAVLFISCSKEVVKEGPADTSFTGKTITFNASIELPVKTRAALIGLDIYWQDGDSIGVATDNNAAIKAYPITVDAIDETKCTFTVEAVPGATAYYALFKGSLNGNEASQKISTGNFKGISFNTETKTFTGLTVGNQQVATGALASYLWYSNGYPLTMAGKSNGNTIVMKPCLALVKLKIHEDSVPDDYYFADNYTSTKNILHEHNYSAVRGFNLYQKGSSTIYSSGDFDVQIAADGSLTTSPTVGGTRKEYRQCSQSAKLSSEVDYLMCLIPGGQITSFLIDFLGYSGNSQSNYSWDAVYTMSKSGSMTVKPGDYYDLGTLNPIGRKKAKNEAEDEAADAAGPFVPKITINGNFTDWASLTEDVISLSAPSQDYQEFKVTYDKLYLYFYTKRNLARQSEWPFYVWYRIDTNNDGNYDKAFYFYPYSKEGSNLVFNTSPASENISGLSLSSAEHTGDDFIEFETSVPRSELSISNAMVLHFKSEMNKVNSGSSLTIAEGLTISDD